MEDIIRLNFKNRSLWINLHVHLGFHSTIFITWICFIKTKVYLCVCYIYICFTYSFFTMSDFFRSIEIILHLKITLNLIECGDFYIKIVVGLIYSLGIIVSNFSSYIIFKKWVGKQDNIFGSLHWSGSQRHRSCPTYITVNSNSVVQVRRYIHILIRFSWPRLFDNDVKYW